MTIDDAYIGMRVRWHTEVYDADLQKPRVWLGR